MMKPSDYEWKATRPDLPRGASSPMMDSRQVTDWLNAAATQGWEFVGMASEQFHGEDIPRTFWIMRRLKAAAERTPR